MGKEREAIGFTGADFTVERSSSPLLSVGAALSAWSEHFPSSCWLILERTVLRFLTELLLLE